MKGCVKGEVVTVKGSGGYCVKGLVWGVNMILYMWSSYFSIL